MLQAIQETLPEASALALELIGLRQQIDMLEMKFSELASAFARTSFWEDQGSNSAIDWLRFKCHLTDRAAGDRIAVGDKLAELPQSIDALQHGEIGFAHVATLARTAKAVGEAFDEEQLLELARKHSPGKFYFKSLHYRHAVDAKGFNREQVGLMENRHLNLATADDGCLLISGVIDPIGGAAVRASLEALARPCGKHDHRSREQRLADALVEQATVGAKVQMQVTASVETLLGLVGAPGAENEFSLPTPPAQPRRGDPKQGGAVGVRLQHQPRPSARLRRDRCRPFGANDQGSAAQGADRQRPTLPVAGM